MKLAVLIPTRGDRPRLFQNWKRLLKNQTLQPDIVEVVDDPPISDAKDITWRYRTGYDRLRNKGLDLIAFMEDDDWYSPDYLQVMVNKWEELGRPQLLGTNYTIYYHIGIFKWHTMNHHTRSSAMATLIRPDMEFTWCADSEPYTDMHIWNDVRLKGHTFRPSRHICLGIKHGVGMSGGMMHKDKMHRYVEDDKDLAFLQTVCDPESFDFYKNYFKTDACASV